jgi:hypothetical protein
MWLFRIDPFLWGSRESFLYVVIVVVVVDVVFFCLGCNVFILLIFGHLACVWCKIEDTRDDQMTKRWSAKKSSLSSMSLSSKEDRREQKRLKKQQEKEQQQQRSPSSSQQHSVVDAESKQQSSKQGSRRATSLLNLFTLSSSSSSPNSQGRFTIIQKKQSAAEFDHFCFIFFCPSFTGSLNFHSFFGYTRVSTETHRHTGNASSGGELSESLVSQGFSRKLSI